MWSRGKRKVNWARKIGPDRVHPRPSPIRLPGAITKSSCKTWEISGQGNRISRGISRRGVVLVATLAIDISRLFGLRSTFCSTFENGQARYGSHGNHRILLRDADSAATVGLAKSFRPGELAMRGNIEQFCLPRPRHLGGGGLESGPARDQLVLGADIFCPARAFAEGMESIGTLPSRFGLGLRSGQERAVCRSRPRS
jgi:hypothetical protein